MRKRTILIAATLLLAASCDQSHLRSAQTAPTPPGNSPLDQEIRRVMEKGGELEERRLQAAAIERTFVRHTEPERARRLAALCYLKTLGTRFMPLDLGEIALAETGSHGLSGRAVSTKGALGVWQLMPERARSHGYTPDEMGNDEKCAEAAVRELGVKLEMARGNLVLAKKFYCGVGPEANAYEQKRRQFRRQILDELQHATPVEARVPISRQRG